MIYKRELIFSSVCGVIALLAYFALPSLVAQPKLLFGRSLSAIAPTLFPQYILLAIALLSGCLVLLAVGKLWSSSELPGDQAESVVNTEKQWHSQAIFFVLLVAYGLMLKPFGFLISSCIVIAGVSLLLGNRNSFQIALLAIVSPICLYLIATRAMLVSLPELNPIELFYSHIINWFRGS